MNDESIMPYGKFKGKKLIDVPARYLLYLLEEECVIPQELKDYIIDNKEGLQQEIKYEDRRNKLF